MARQGWARSGRARLGPARPGEGGSWATRYRNNKGGGWRSAGTQIQGEAWLGAAGPGKARRQSNLPPRISQYTEEL